MDAQRLSQLIGLIYDSSVDLDLWPILLQGLADELEPGMAEGGAGLPRLERPQVESIERLGEYVSQWYEGGLEEGALLEAERKIRNFSGEENQFIQLLLPHFIRALRINLNLVELNAENRAFASVLERLPIGMAIVERDGRLQAKNRRFDELLAGRCGLAIKGGRLVAVEAADSTPFKTLITEVADAGEEEAMGRAMRLSGVLPSSVMLLPLGSEATIVGRSRVIVFLASLVSEVDIDPKTLHALYGLTKAESRLTLALVNGATVDEIAEQYHVSTHTLRTQLKSVYAKTDCRRQAELVVKVLTSPAMLAEKVTEPLPTQGLDFMMEVDDENESPRTRQFMYLSDGRRLCFAEYGPENGYPTLMMHGVTGSRLQVNPDESPLYEHNVRLLIPERPGYGYSDSLEERSILDWNRDLDELVEFLGLERFALLGYSVGGSFSMAAAIHFEDRVSHLSLVSSMGQYHDLEDLDGMLPMFRMLLGLGKYTPSIAMALMRLMTRSIRSKPDKYFERIIEQSPQMDKEVLSDPEIQAVYTRSIMEAARQGERDMMLEQLMMARDWGFSLHQVQVPVSMWHGELDRHVPLSMARAIQQQIPQARFQLIQGAGHFLIFRYWPEIIADLAEAVQAA